MARSVTVSCSKDGNKTASVCPHSNINEKGSFKNVFLKLVWLGVNAVLSRPVGALSKLVHVIDFLWGLSLLKESTLSMELLPQPLR